MLLIILFPTLSWASPAEEPKTNSIPILDSAQQFFGGQVNTVANRLDLFFADQRADDELARSRVRIRQSYEVRERSLPSDDTQISVNLKLPGLEDKFRFDWFQSEEEKAKEQEKKRLKKKGKGSKAVAKKPATKPSITNKSLDTNWQFRSTLGFSAKIPPVVTWNNRLRKNFVTGTVINRFVEQLSWFSDRDWETQTTLDNDHSITENILFRFRDTVDWRITRKGFKTGHGPILLHRVTDDDAFSYGFTTSTIVEDGVWYVSNYRVAPTYRRNVYHHFVYFNLTPGLDFPKDWSFRRTPFIFAQLEMLFGGG